MPSITDKNDSDSERSLEKLELQALEPQKISAKDTEEWFQQSWLRAQEWLTDVNSYTQVAVVISVIVVAYTLGYIFRNQFDLLKEPSPGVRQESLKWFIRRTGRLFSPLFLYISLLIIERFKPPFLENHNLFGIATHIAFIWLLWVTLRAFVTNSFVRTIAIWILVPAALLHLIGIFEPTVEYLDSLGFAVGDYRITIYSCIRGFFIVSFLVWISHLLSNNAETYIRHRESLNSSTKELLIKFSSIFFYFIIAIIILQLIGIDLTALTIFGGAIGVGLGFGLQKIASNFISGIILLTERNITIGNLVQLDNGMLGFVRSMGARASVLETYDGREVIVPNEDFIISRVSNLTHSNTLGRVDFMVGVSYKSDMDLVKEVILKALNTLDISLKDPEPAVYMREFGDNSVNFAAMFWIEDVSSGRWPAQDEAMYAVWRALRENNIEIPFPQRDLHLKSGFEHIPLDAPSK